MLSLIVMAFAVAVQAGDATTCQDKDNETGLLRQQDQDLHRGQGMLSFCQERLLQASLGQANRDQAVVLQSPKAVAEASK